MEFLMQRRELLIIFVGESSISGYVNEDDSLGIVLSLQVDKLGLHSINALHSMIEHISFTCFAGLLPRFLHHFKCETSHY